jgi:hypothetical protein
VHWHYDLHERNPDSHEHGNPKKQGNNVPGVVDSPPLFEKPVSHNTIYLAYSLINLAGTACWTKKVFEKKPWKKEKA